MARSVGSTFQNTLPIAWKYRGGAINWGLVQGKTQTYYPWDSWQRPHAYEPTPWFHDVLRTDGRPYDPKETERRDDPRGAFRIPLNLGPHGGLRRTETLPRRSYVHS
jgi:hypothetical protein